jgi:aspartate aminotransferase
LTSSFI